jgi:hypothetical protein
MSGIAGAIETQQFSAMSLQLNELFAALALAQGEGLAALKDATGQIGQQKTRYADLAACWEACRGPLSKHGLSVIQIPSAEGMRVTIKTILGHKSGQYISAELTMTSTVGTPQGLGSAITYARRYSLCSLVGIAPEDDDGAAASSRQQPKQETRPPARSTKPEDEDQTQQTEATATTAPEADTRKWPATFQELLDRAATSPKEIKPVVNILHDWMIQKAGVDGDSKADEIGKRFKAAHPTMASVKPSDVRAMLIEMWEALQALPAVQPDLAAVARPFGGQ